MPADTEQLRLKLSHARDLLRKIVVTEGTDAGVVLLSQEGPTHYNPEVNGQVYNHEYFSPLGDALIKLYKLLSPPDECGLSGSDVLSMERERAEGEIAIWNIVQSMSPWAKSNDMEWADEIICGLDGIEQKLRQYELSLLKHAVVKCGTDPDDAPILGWYECQECKRTSDSPESIDHKEDCILFGVQK